MSDKQFIHLHQHDFNSNQQYLEVVSSIEDYIEIAKERKNTAVCISNHGNVIDWYDRKVKIESTLVNGKPLKYIHAIEAFVTDSPDKKVRDNFHVLLMAKNEKGWREINKLSSKSFTRTDNHYYYAPRMYAEEIFNSSENVIVLSACLGSPLWQNFKSGNIERFERWVKFFADNKERAYLELQPHNEEEQKEYNKLLLELSYKHDLRIVATNDVHASTKEHEVTRKLLKKSKGVAYETDDDYELWAKTRDEMVESFVTQGVLTSEEIERALDETVAIVDSIEEFEVDTSIKYPKMFFKEMQKVGDLDISFLRDKPFEDSLDVLKQLIVNGYRYREINKLSQSEQERYKARVNHELRAFIETGSVDYILLEWMVKYCGVNKIINPDKPIHAGYGRGSSSGSLICYLLNIVQVDAVKEGLNFERFINKDRVSIADIDTDYEPESQTIVQQWLLANKAFDSASIVTKGTYGLKGAIKAMGKGLGYSPTELNGITKLVDDKTGEIPLSVYENNKELIDISKKVMGTVQSYGRHACGIVITSEPLDEVMGTMTLSDWDYPVTQLNMKSIDKLSFTKLDVLSLDTLGLIHKTCEMAGIPNITPYDGTVDFQSPEIYKGMAESNIGIFQFESDRAGKLLKDMFSDETIGRMKEINPDFKYLDLVSLLNSGQRPSGASFVENLVEARPRTWGIKPLDDFLKGSLGELVFQETQTAFLVEMCGWSNGHADLIRRGIGKKSKEIMDVEVPKIKPSFVKYMVEEFGEDEEVVDNVADSFVKVFIDSADYGFSLNHSLPYSAYGAVSSFLKLNYPLEFVASALEIWKKGDKHVEFLKYAETIGIKILPPKFRKSKGGYFVDKENNAIYQGTSHIKGSNDNVAEQLYTLKDRKYESFTNLVIDIIENSDITIDNENMKVYDFYKKYSQSKLKEIDKTLKQDSSLLTFEKNPLGIKKNVIEGLIKLNFFDEFGKAKKLMNVYEYVLKNYKPNNKTFSGKAIKYLACLEYEASLEDEGFSIVEQCENELELTGRVTVQSETIPPRYAFVTDIDVKKTLTNATVYSINKGQYTQVKVGAKTYREAKFEAGDLIELQDIQVKAKRVQQDGKWVASSTDKDLWVKQLKFIRKSNVKKKD